MGFVRGGCLSEADRNRVGFGLHGVGFGVLACGLREMDAFWRRSMWAFTRSSPYSSSTRAVGAAGCSGCAR